MRKEVSEISLVSILLKWTKTETDMCGITKHKGCGKNILFHREIELSLDAPARNNKLQDPVELPVATPYCQQLG